MKSTGVNNSTNIGSIPLIVPVSHVSEHAQYQSLELAHLNEMQLLMLYSKTQLYWYRYVFFTYIILYIYYVENHEYILLINIKQWD